MNNKESKRLSIWRAIKYLIFLSLAFILLYLSFGEMDWKHFIDALKSCNYYWIAASMLLGVAGFVLRALRWQQLLKEINKDVTLRECYDGVNVGYLTNFVLPRAGEFSRCGVIANTKKVSFEGALGSVVLERALDMACLIGWVVLLLVFKWNEFGGFISHQLFEPLFGRFSSTIIYIAIALFIAAIAITIIAWRNRERLLRIKLFNKIATIIEHLIEGILSALKLKNKWLFLLYTLLIWLSYWLTSLTTIYALPSVATLNATDALFLMIVGGLGWIVPVQGGIGAYHFVITLALTSLYAIPQKTAFIFATISHESQAVIMIICGLLSLISISLNKRRS